MRISLVILALAELWLNSTATSTTGQLYATVDGKDLAHNVTRDVLSDVTSQHQCLFRCTSRQYCRAFAVCATGGESRLYIHIWLMYERRWMLYIAWICSQSDLGKSKLTNLLDYAISGKISCKLSDQEINSNDSMITNSECRVFTRKCARTLRSGYVHQPVDAYICQWACTPAGGCINWSVGMYSGQWANQSADVQSILVIFWCMW